MRIISGLSGENESLLQICREMINLESHKEVFDPDGNSLENKTDYPVLNLASGQVSIKPAMGYIFLSPNIDIDKFIARLSKQIVTFSDEHLRTYHSVGAPVSHTHTKIKCQMKYTDNGSKSGNILRAIKYSRQNGYIPSDNSGVRFVWFVCSIREFSYDITTVDTYKVLHNHMVSIFYDYDNIVKLSNWTFVSTFRKSMFKNYDNMLDISLKLSRYATPICFEVSTFWEKQRINERFVYRNLQPRQHFYKKKLEDVTLCNKKNSDDNYLCVTCLTPLYDDNYVLSVPLRDPTNTMSIALCPLCMHTSSKKVELQYLWTFRVTFPLTISKLVEKMAIENIKKDILLKCLDKIQWFEEYILIGDDYVGLHNRDDFLLNTNKEFNTRKAFILEK
jgi:hypothetical protein